MAADLDAMLAEMHSLLAKVQADVPAGDPGLTCAEWAEAWGVGPFTARRRLRDLFDRGLILNGRRRTTYMDGRLGSLPVYRPRP